MKGRIIQPAGSDESEAMPPVASPPAAIKKKSRRRVIIVELSAKFVSLAAHNHISPELLARLWCDTLAMRDPNVLTFKTSQPLEELEIVAQASQRLWSDLQQEGGAQ